jgi:alpha-N-arabinofuranosidase
MTFADLAPGPMRRDLPQEVSPFLRSHHPAGVSMSRTSTLLSASVRRLLGSLFCAATGILIAQANSSGSDPAHLTVDAAEAVVAVSPSLYGLMTEEINHSYEGGLYGELLQNRTFHTTWEGAPPWNLVLRGDAAANRSLDKSTGPSQALPYSLKLSVSSANARSEAGITNPGFWGIALQPHTTYKGSFYGRVADASPGALTARLVSDRAGTVLASAEITLHSGAWSRYSFTLTTGELAASAENHFELTAARPGTVWLQLISLFPPTFHNRPNGNRIDLMERMAGLRPHFLRLPGGNYLEGDTLADWYDWKKTIGPLVDRPGHQAPWTYWSTDGLGLLEFLEWCEDLHIEPVLAVYAGYVLKGDHIEPGPALEPYVQSALDEVEYVTGDASTKWGAERARDGHPAPFPLHYIEIGNEDWLDKSGSYAVRYPQFARALRKKYPQYKLIATDWVKETDAATRPDVVDDHFYKEPADMFDLVHHYDNTPRSGPRVFVGEWATRSGTPTPNFGDTLGDAAWMTSLERNSDLIVMAAYAPLLVNVNPGAMQWATDLIGFNALTTYASPSYYAQCLFADHLGNSTVRTKLEGAGSRFFYSATVSSSHHVLHLKFVNANTQDQPLTIDLHGASPTGQDATMNSLHAATFQATNSIVEPALIHPVETTVHVSAAEWHHTVPALAIEVIDVPLH